MMTDIIFAYDDFRVRDHDENNYVVEQHIVTDKKESWKVRGYVTTGKSALTLFERCLVQKYEQEAGLKAKSNLMSALGINAFNQMTQKRYVKKAEGG